MKTQKHTPGPWKAVKYQSSSYYTVRQDHATYGIDAKTLAGSDDDLRFHDAHLIAAAPELLEALEAVFLRLTFEHVTDWRAERRLIGEIVGTAIKKARGES